MHKLPADLESVIVSDKLVKSLWDDITPLARNEWICWVISAKKPETRARRIMRVKEELLEGKRRPCCWAGCIHRWKKSHEECFLLVASGFVDFFDWLYKHVCAGCFWRAAMVIGFNNSFDTKLYSYCDNYCCLEKWNRGWMPFFARRGFVACFYTPWGFNNCNSCFYCRRAFFS